MVGFLITEFVVQSVKVSAQGMCLAERVSFDHRCVLLYIDGMQLHLYLLPWRWSEYRKKLATPEKQPCTSSIMPFILIVKNKYEYLITYFINKIYKITPYHLALVLPIVFQSHFNEQAYQLFRNVTNYMDQNTYLDFLWK